VPEPKGDYRHTDAATAGGDRQPSKYFGKGNPGRRRGATGLTHRLVRLAVIEAAERSAHNQTGDLVGYCQFLADQHPKVFARSLLGRLLPLQVRADISVGQKLETVEEVRAKLAAAGLPMHRLERLFDRPKVPEPRPLPEPDPPRDEDNLSREPDHTSEPNGLDRAHEPSRRRYGPDRTDEPPRRDVRDFQAAIMTPGGAWHSMPLNKQMDLPIDEKEPTDADGSNDPQAV
jgi:hypothetical protein